MSAPRLGIVILNWNGGDVTRRCLVSLRARTYPAATVYLVDNGSSDSSPQRLMAEFAGDGVVLIENGANLGFAAGNNPGIRRALADGCELVLLLNNDVVCTHRDFIEAGVDAMLGTPDTGIVGGKLTGWPDTSRLWSVGGEVAWMNERFLGLGERDTGQFDSPASRTFVSGAMMLVRRAVFERIGLLPDVYWFGSEDREFSVRAHRAGFGLRYEPCFRAAHEAGASHSAVRPEWVYFDALSRMLFKRRNQPAWSHALWRAAYFAYVEWLFPLRHALHPGQVMPGLAASELRGLLREAWRDARGIEHTTPDQLAEFRARLAGRRAGSGAE